MALLPNGIIQTIIYKMLKKLIKYLTPKKINMSKSELTKNEKNALKYAESSEIFKALQRSNENLKTIKKQFSFDEQHFISITIRANDELIKTF
jgi:hypothetical protein